MDNKRRALGKGLEQLFNSEPLNYEQLEQNIVINTQENDIVEIPLDEIRSNPYQPREHFDEDTLNELAQSIKEYGVFQPIIVKKSIKGYELVAGERRTKASKIAGKTTIPAIIKEFSDQDMMDIAISENIQREDLSSIEIAEAFKKYIEYTKITQEEMAKKFGKSRSYVTNLLGLLTLPDNIRVEINKNRISMSHAKILSKLNDIDKINELADKIINENMSVRELEKQSSNDLVPRKKPIKRVQNKSITSTIYEKVLREKTGSKVVVSNNKITIPYDSEADLQRIMEILYVEMDNE